MTDWGTSSVISWAHGRVLCLFWARKEEHQYSPVNSSDYREHIIQNMSVLTKDLVNVSGIRITLRTPDAFINCSVCVPCSQENTDFSLCTQNTQRTRPCAQGRTPGGVPNQLHFDIRKSVLGIVSRGSFTVQTSFIFRFFFSLKESVTELIYTLKSRWIWTRANALSLVSAMVVQRNVWLFSWSWRSSSSGSGHWKCQKNSQNESDVWIQLSIQSIQCGRQCAWEVLFPRATGFQTPACLMLKWPSAAILCRFVGINSCVVKVGFGTIIWSSNSSTILDVHRQTRCTRRISNNGVGNQPQHYFGVSDALPPCKSGLRWKINSTICLLLIQIQYVLFIKVQSVMYHLRHRTNIHKLTTWGIWGTNRNSI